MSLVAEAVEETVWIKAPAYQTPDINQTLSERGERYGPFEGHAKITQHLKATMRLYPGFHNLTDSQTEALDMIAHKIGRILNGDPNYADSWVDISGYAQLVVRQLDGNPL